MNPTKEPEEENLFLHHDHQPQPEPSFPNGNNNNNNNNDPSCFADSSSNSSTESPPPPSATATAAAAVATVPFISPEPHISTQFYTFNAESHSLMLRSLLHGTVPSAADIAAATPPPLLASWRAVWKDRSEDTAYLTAWKRIQDKLATRTDQNGNRFLCFKNNSHQLVPHVNQWQHIVMSFHTDADLKHLGLKETVERIKQVWTVGAKFYGIPESYIRVCLAACPICSSSAASAAGKTGKRRRFEYTESIDVPAREVPRRLQQLAAKHKVVLCIRQKYIRFKPVMAEVKDYACHRAGEPAPPPAADAKKSKVLKREPYASKRCGCGFRIRAIVPIKNYNEKDKTFVYEEEGVATFKLYAVHSGHEPGPLDGNARIIHRVVGHKAGFPMDQEMVYGVSEDLENEGFGLMGKDEGDLQFSVLQQVQELKAEVGVLEGRVSKMPRELLDSVSRELLDIVNKIRNLGEVGSKPIESLPDEPESLGILLGENDLAHWSNHEQEQIYGNGKDTELIEVDDDEDSFGRALEEVASWNQMRADCTSQKDLLSETCKPEKWLKCSDFNEKNILDYEDIKLTKPIRHDEPIVEEDVGLGCIQVDSFYQDNPKWYDSPCGLDTGADCGDSGFFHGEILSCHERQS